MNLRHRAALGAAISALSFLPPAHAADADCTAVTAPAMVADARATTMRHTAADGTCLQGFEWQPAAGPARGLVIIAHGLRDHASRYGTLVQALAAKGLVVHAQDMRGHGHSGGTPQRFDSLEQLAADLDLGVQDARKRHPGLPVFVFGHSLGGLLSTHYALSHAADVRGVVLSAPFLQLLPEVGGGAKFGARLIGTIAPPLRIQKVDDSVFLRDGPAKKAFYDDQRVDHRNLPAASARAGLNGLEAVQARMLELSVPLLALHGTADQAVTIEGTRRLVKGAAGADKTLREVPGAYHDLMNEPEAAQLAGEVADWIVARLSAAKG